MSETDNDGWRPEPDYDVGYFPGAAETLSAPAGYWARL
jgi:hypothetical protein